MIINGNAEPAVLVSLDTRNGTPYSLTELELLVETAGGKVIARVEQKKDRPDPAFFIGKGKIEEIKVLLEETGSLLIVFNHELSPTQVRNLENSLGEGVKIVDRTALILDIFARRALSREGKLQVELAQLSYMLPRLTGRRSHLSRLGGGIGTRGPGETQLEVDRRTINKRIAVLKKQISQIRKHRHLHRDQRKARGHTLVALVGYTNAGKSTLLNALTGAQVYTENKLFATLDPTVKQMPFYPHKSILLTDTVGFIDNLPPQLVDAFQATLEEITEAYLLLHVVDLGDTAFEKRIEAVNDVLGKIGLDEKNEILIFNKIDILLEQDLAYYRRMLPREYPDCVFLSALTGEGFTDLWSKIEGALQHGTVRMNICIPYEKWPGIHHLYEKGKILKIDYEPNGVRVEADIEAPYCKEFEPYAESPAPKNQEG